MKLSVKTTFDFGKLANKTKKIIADFTTDTIKEESNEMKKRLSSGNTVHNSPMEGISDVSKHIREIRKDRPSSSTKPMYDRGDLYKSITPTKEGVKINKYGKYHQNSHKTVTNKFTKWYFMETGKNIANKTVPARRWIHDSETFKNSKKAMDGLFKKIKEGLKK